MNAAAATRVLEGAVGAGLTPGAVAVVGRGREPLAEITVGSLGREADDRATDVDSLYDLSSLTKPLVTCALMMRLVASGRCRPDQQAAEFLPLMGPGVTLASLLGHNSGLPAWVDFHDAVRAAAREAGGPLLASEAAKQMVYRLAQRVALQAPPGRRTLYSDIGYILLGAIIEAVTGQPLHVCARRELFDPLGLRATSFVVAYDQAHAAGRIDPARVAPCGLSLARSRPVCGFVHDDTAYAMGGAAGHAGLFSTAGEVHRLVAEHVAACSGDSGLLDGATVESFWSLHRRLPGSTWVLGWDTPSERGSTAGRHISAGSVGHLGFTGTSVWIDRKRGLHVVLLTNRLQRGASREALNRMRASFHDAVFEAFDRA